jgi:predicted nucleic acid-binding protein
LIAYADTGFLVSLYGCDANSDLAAGLVKSKPVFFLTNLIELEFANALELRVFRKEWTRRDARAVMDHFLQHQAAGVFRIEAMAKEVWDQTLILSRRHSAVYGTRTLDLLHLASALVLKADAMFTFDGRQRTAAKAEKVRVVPS